jgi:glycosyltransferase involved in cell wall biosynthesis
MPSAERPLRVLHVALALNPGGAERLVVDLASRAPAGIEAAVCCLDEVGSWARGLQERGVPVIALGRRPGFHPSLALRLARILSARQVDVLHCHQYTPFVYGSLAKLLRPRTRLVFTEHGRLSDAAPSTRRRRANAWLGRIPGRFFAVSDELRGFLEAEGFPAGRLEVLPNGIDPGSPPAAADRVRSRAALDLPEGVPVVGTAARLDPVKDLPSLVAAFARLRERLPSVRLVVVGDGPERGRIEREVSSRGLAAAVSLPGHRADVRALLPGFDLYVNCSTYEGVSLTILEAMAAGLPVVATRVGGTPEVVVDGETGLLVPPRDDAALEAALADLLADRERRIRLGAAGRARVEQRFAFDRMMSMYRKAWEGE